MHYEPEADRSFRRERERVSKQTASQKPITNPLTKPIINEYGVIKNVEILDNINAMYDIVIKFLRQKESELTLQELMVLQRHYSMNIDGAFCDVILKKQFENKQRSGEI